MRINALHNCKNPFQGKDKKVLCVCSAGLLRSPTLANVLHKEFGFNTRACGVHDYALIQFDEVLAEWADEIVVVEEYIANHIPENYDHKVTILAIPDQYGYMNPTLQRICLEQYNNLKGNKDAN